MRGTASTASTPPRCEPLRHPEGAKDGKGKDISGEPILDAKGEPQWHHPVLNAKERIAMAARLILL